MDDSGCVTATVILVILFFVGWLAIIAIELLAITYPVWGMGVTSALIGYGISRFKLDSNLSTPSKISELTELNFDSLRLRGKVNQKAVEDYTKGFKIFPIALCIFTTITALGIFTLYSNKLSNLVEGKLSFAIFSTFFIPIVISVLIWKNRDFITLTENKLNHSIKKVNRTFQASEKLKQQIRTNKEIARKVGIEFQQDNIQEIQDFVDSYGAKIIAEPLILDSVIENEIEKAEKVFSNLDNAKRLLDDYLRLHTKISKTIFSTGSPSMVNALDMVHEEMHQAKEVCLPKREWSTFEEALLMYSEEIKKLEKQAKKLTSEKRPEFESNDPYRILGVTCEMSDKEIKKIFRELCQIYHPDKGKVKDASKFKEIKEAFDKIKKQQKF